LPTSQSESSSPLECYGHNLTMLAQLGSFSPLAGQDALVDRVLQILLRKNKCNPVLLDFDETRRWEVVAEVVRRMAMGDAPDSLCKRQVIALDYEALFANQSDEALSRLERKKQMLMSRLEEEWALGEQESDEEWWDRVGKMPLWPELEEWIAPTVVLERLQSMFIAMHRSADSFVLFVDHFHRLVGGEWDRYPVDAVTLLKPALARHQVQLIGACTLAQYRLHIERDAAIQRRCQEVLVSRSDERT
jgi:ATP-dependent Clp protease ATP-binding subunit ClpB